MQYLDMFMPLIKVDVDRRMVQGVATAEAPDRAGEICDYDTTKPYFEAWSAEAQEASGGKSLGAVRAMHQRIAAGKLTDISFDDQGKRILVAAKIVDDDEWAKVMEGVYTGFSQGGRYVARWVDETTGLTRYTADPTEISLVDVPCLPGATFQMVKDGIVEEHAFSPEPRQTQLVEKAIETPAPDPAAPPPPPEAPQSYTSQELATAALVVASAADRLEKALEENSHLRVELDKLAPKLEDVLKRVKDLESKPAPPKALLRAPPREHEAPLSDIPGGVDAAIKLLSGLPDKERTHALMKVSLANPRHLPF